MGLTDNGHIEIRRSLYHSWVFQRTSLV